MYALPRTHYTDKNKQFPKKVSIGATIRLYKFRKWIRETKGSKFWRLWMGLPQETVEKCLHCQVLPNTQPIGRPKHQKHADVVLEDRSEIKLSAWLVPSEEWMKETIWFLPCLSASFWWVWESLGAIIFPLRGSVLKSPLCVGMLITSDLTSSGVFYIYNEVIFK